MPKKISLIFLISIGYILCLASNIDISWNKPNLSSNIFYSFLENNNFPEYVESIDSQNKHSYFALESTKNLTLSIKDYFSKNKTYNFFKYRFSQNSLDGFISLSPQIGFEYFFDDNNAYKFFHYGIDLQANLDNTLYITGNWWTGGFTEDLDFAVEQSPIFDSWLKPNCEDVLYFDNLKGRIDWRGRLGSLAIGRGTYEIGSNISSSIILNDDCNDYGYISSNIKLGNLTLSILHATLIPDSTNYQMGEPYNQSYKFEDKYLMVHKLDWIPSKRLHLFFGESIIYGSRSIDPSYLLPHVFQRITEHNLADRDNVLIFAGGELNLTEDLMLYSNIMFDEMRKSEILGDWWGNKYAIQSGISFNASLLKIDRIGLEFTAIRPWLYTHNQMVNKYSNDDIGLGYKDGSNLIKYTCELNTKATSDIKLDFRSSYKRQGDLGNSFTLNYDNRPKDTAKWLDGVITDTFEAESILTWQLLACHFIKLGLSYQKVIDSNEQTQISFAYFTRY